MGVERRYLLGGRSAWAMKWKLAQNVFGESYNSVSLEHRAYEECSEQ